MSDVVSTPNAALPIAIKSVSSIASPTGTETGVVVSSAGDVLGYPKRPLKLVKADVAMLGTIVGTTAWRDAGNTPQ